ncbi:MAG: hypothetical protein IJG80_09615, partial [Selenomonadaceae bacterium]|nr:hypothetical protein [Selenomonadaceae bacterium]
FLSVEPYFSFAHPKDPLKKRGNSKGHQPTLDVVTPESKPTGCNVTLPKEKGASRGRLLVRDLEVEVTRSVELRRTPLSCGVCGAAVILDGLKLAAHRFDSVNQLARRMSRRGKNVRE